MTTSAGDFKVDIIRNGTTQAKLISGAYAPFYCMKNGDTYSIVVVNRGPTKCDARVTIDDELIGVWRIHPGGSNTITTPLNVHKYLVFKSGSGFKFKETVDGSYPVSGKISIEFLPEVGRSPDVSIPYQHLYSVKLDGSQGCQQAIDMISIQQNLV